MKLITGIVILLLPFMLFAQNNTGTGKSLLIVFTKDYAACGQKAIFIKDSTVQIDSCYSRTKKEFTVHIRASVNDNILYSRLFNLNASQWKYIEQDIKQVNQCDFAVPYEIELKANNTTHHFSLNRVINCYPSSAKYYLEAMDLFFNSL